MAFQYFCNNQFRAQRVRSNPATPGNGIDYLEVLDSDSPIESLRQRTLLVRLFKPVPNTLQVDNIKIEGGIKAVSYTHLTLPTILLV